MRSRRRKPTPKTRFKTPRKSNKKSRRGQRGQTVQRGGRGQTVQRGGRVQRGQRGQRGQTGGRPLKPLVCGPLATSRRKHTCYSDDQLEQLKDRWNKSHPNNLIMATDPEQLWTELSDRHTHCPNEQCWVNDKHSNLNSVFAPKAPDSWLKNKNEWLSDTDISLVMVQYTQKYPDFTFIGPTPIDFDKKKSHDRCVWDDLCKFDLKQHMDNGKRKIGVIFNTDTSDGPGIHWISLFIDVSDMKDPYMYYFDSGGSKPPKEVSALTARIQEQGTHLHPPLTILFEHNKVAHQKGGTECGMYSLYFLTGLLDGTVRSIHDLTDPANGNKITDAFVESQRHRFFNIYY